MNYAAICIGIFIFILAYFTFNAPKTPALKPQEPEVQSSTYCESVDPAAAPTFQAPADIVTKLGWDDVDRTTGTLIRDPEGCGGDRHQLTDELVTYRLIRKSVPLTKTDVKKKDFNWDDSSCHFDTAEKLGINISEVDTSKFKVFFPEISGEISLDRLLFSRTRGGERDLMYFIDYGLVFLLHINPDGSLTELKGGTTQGQSETFVLADIYQDIDSERPDLPEEAFACDTTQGARIASSKQVIIPPQSPSPDQDELQLEYFVFGNGASSGQVVNGWGIHCKPAVYLYPPKKQLVNVKVNPLGELSYTDPPYNPARGWTVWAESNGILSTTYNLTPTTYPYLYYETKLLDSEIKKPDKGWVVSNQKLNMKNQKDLEQLLNEILPKLGLNAKEQKDFMDYWLSKLPNSPYYFVGLVDKSQRDYLEALSVTPNPDTSIRFSLYFEMLDEPMDVPEPEIDTPTRNGFTLVDWGGMVKLHPGTPFTCSQ